MMEYRLRNTGAVVSDMDFRTTIHADKLLPAVLTPDMLDHLGADAVLASPQPVPTSEQTVIRDGVEQDALGNWVQRWSLVAIPSETLDEARQAAITTGWEAIKQERDGPRVDGGVKVGGAWFHTDQASRIKWLGLKDTARDMLLLGMSMHTVIVLEGRSLAWKTMSGVWAPVTMQLAYDVVQAIKNLDANLFLVAEQHYAALKASPNPASYNYLTGWPEKWPPGT